jgi:predicted enzyme related to lactoylglutathione lyase
MSDGMKPGDFCWHEQMSRDDTRAADFYRELFGWDTDTQPMRQPDGTETRYTMAANHGIGVAGFVQMTGDIFLGVPPNWTIYVAVDNADATVAQARAMGGTIRRAPSAIPNMGRFALIEDPTGAVFGIWEPSIKPWNEPSAPESDKSVEAAGAASLTEPPSSDGAEVEALRDEIEQLRSALSAALASAKSGGGKKPKSSRKATKPAKKAAKKAAKQPAAKTAKKASKKPAKKSKKK